MHKLASKQEEIVQLLYQLKRQAQGDLPIYLDLRVLPVVLVELVTSRDTVPSKTSPSG